MQREFLLFSDSLLWLAPIESHSRDRDWGWSGISQNSASTTNSKITAADMIRTKSKSEAEISSLKDDDLSPGAESSPVSPQKLDRRKSHFHAVPPPPPNMDRLMINLSTGDEFNSLILRTRGGLRCRVPKHWASAVWIPDGETSFWWRRRRGHCRLCGRCICASCSGRVSSIIIIIIPFFLDLISVFSLMIKF